MRIVAIALAAFAVAGCGADTVLRIEIPDPGASPPPASLRITLVGVNAAPRTITPVVFPGTVVVHNVPSSISQLCVQVDGLDGSGNIIVGGAANVLLATHRTTNTTIALSDSAPSCSEIVPFDLSVGAVDMASGGGGAAGGGGGGGGTALVDMATIPDMATIQICPTGAIFCDDFETGNTSKWTGQDVKQDAGSIVVQSTTKRHGTYALRALANGASGAEEYAELFKNFTPTAPPFALRANIFYPATLQHYDHLLTIYESTSTTNNFSIGGDSNATWVVTENEANAPDRHSDMVPTGSGQWHCVELVIDAGGMVTLFVDNHQLIGPWQRASNVTYSHLLVGVTRSVDTDFVGYIDDVAIGPSRLYCPP